MITFEDVFRGIAPESNHCNVFVQIHFCLLFRNNCCKLLILNSFWGVNLFKHTSFIEQSMRVVYKASSRNLGWVSLLLDFFLAIFWAWAGYLFAIWICNRHFKSEGTESFAFFSSPRHIVCFNEGSCHELYCYILSLFCRVWDTLVESTPLKWDIFVVVFLKICEMLVCNLCSSNLRLFVSTIVLLLVGSCKIAVELAFSELSVVVTSVIPECRNSIERVMGLRWL